MNAKADRLEAKREEILAAASAVFGAEGYETTSMDRVAEAAKASKRTVYNHFKSKEALFQAAIARMLEQWRARKAVAWDPQRSLADQLAEFAHAKVAMTEDAPSMALFRVAIAVATRDPSILTQVIARYAAEDDALAQWLRAADAAGALNVPDPTLAAELFWAMAGGALFWPAVVGQLPTNADRMCEEMVETFLARYRP